MATGSTNWIAAVSGSTADPASTCALADISAMRWISTTVLAPQETGEVDFTVQAVGNAPNDIYVNRYTGYTASFLNKPVRSNEPFVQVIGFSLGDLIWLDINDNGIFDEGLDIPAPAGVTVNLFRTNVGMVDSTTTDAQGRWFFEELSGGQYTGGATYVAGEYYVVVTGLPVGWVVDATSATFVVDPNNKLK